MITRLTAAERALRDAIKPGAKVDHSAGGATIRAFVLQEVLLDDRAPCRSLVVRDAKVVDALDLEAGTIGYPVEFVGCAFAGEPNVEQAKLFGLYLTGCRLPGLSGAQVDVAHNLELVGCDCSGLVDLIGARVHGQLLLTGSRLANPAGHALAADGMKVYQDVKFSGGFRAESPVRMIGARIGGQFDCDGAHFLKAGEVALDLKGAVIDERVYWRDGFLVEGEVRVADARLRGGLDCTGAVFRHPAAVALRASGVVVDSDVRFRGASVEGPADFTGCDVTGMLDLTGGRFSSPGETALDLARARVRQNMICRSGFEVRGRVLLAGADIGGSLWCEGGHVENSTDTALDATGLVVHRDLHLGHRRSASGAGDDGFHAEGAVVLSGACVEGDLDCAGGRFTNPAGESITAIGLTVERDLLMSDGFVADGVVDLAGAEVHGCLVWSGGRFTNRSRAIRADRAEVGHSAKLDGLHADGPVLMRGMRIAGNLDIADARISDDETALVLEGTTVRGRLRVGFTTKPAGGVDLRYASAGQLDDRDCKWPDRLRLTEFVYKALPVNGLSRAVRVQCLRGGAEEYVPQVYLQLAKVYEAAGKHDDAKHVLIAGQDAGRRAGRGVRGAIDRALGFVLKWTVGYGYRPLWVLYWVAALTVVGAVAAAVAHPDGFRRAKADLDVGFEPVLYTLDLLLPVVNLRQRELWVPVGWVLWGSSVFTALGWVLAICLVTGLGKAFKREL
ncbi:hypothetical protein GCM10010492_00140 [Saccharothrix mutabilis subsp. mutabilis]|uniref:Membrane-associated oxidoreductase n=1 Tax=Saccharothrix mutabilis subsp. mutabilis TaxID=66855 RepID=A0ABP3CII2_9PSEU